MASFFIQTRLTKAIYNCKQELVELSQALLPKTDPNAEAVAHNFMEACEKQDSNTLNAMLEKYLLTYMKADDIYSAFYKFCRKFGITADLAGQDIPEIIQIIAGYAPEISDKLAKAGY